MMLEGGTEREILSLLELYNLKSHLARFEDDQNCLDTLTQLLINAYVITKDRRFFGLFYVVSYPSHISWAKSYLQRINSPVSPDDIVSDAYTKFFNLCLENKIENIRNLTGYMNRIIKNLTSQANSKYLKDTQPAASCTLYTTEFKAKPIDILIRFEEEDRKEKQFAFIKELLLGRHEGLTDGDREIFTEFYINNKTAQNIALQKNTSMYNINKVLYRIKKKIKRLTRSYISLSRREEEV